jgi:predicted DNA binding protein
MATRLTKEQVTEIKDAYTAKIANQSQLAKKFGVSQPTINYHLRKLNLTKKRSSKAEIVTTD